MRASVDGRLAAQEAPHALAVMIVARIAEVSAERNQYARRVDQARDWIERALSIEPRGRRLAAVSLMPVSVEHKLRTFPPKLQALVVEADGSGAEGQSSFVADDAEGLVNAVALAGPAVRQRGGGRGHVRHPGAAMPPAVDTTA